MLFSCYHSYFTKSFKNDNCQLLLIVLGSSDEYLHPMSQNKKETSSFLILPQQIHLCFKQKTMFHLKIVVFTVVKIAAYCIGMLSSRIMITCPCNEHPFPSHFYIVKHRFTGVFIFFALKHRMWVVVRTASAGGSDMYPQSMF